MEPIAKYHYFLLLTDNKPQFYLNATFPENTNN